MKTIKNLPVYLVEIIKPDEGLEYVSLVEKPATMQDFVCFAKDKMTFSVQDPEKRIVSGVVMLADTPIYRRSPKLGEYYMVFTRDVIEKLVEKMSQEGRFNNITLNHEERVKETVTPTEGVTLIEIFIKDSSKGINPTYLQDIPEGSLIASYKVENEALWSLIKSGEFKGFSITGLFSVVPEDEPSELDDILNLIHQVKGKYGLK